MHLFQHLVYVMLPLLCIIWFVCDVITLCHHSMSDTFRIWHVKTMEWEFKFYRTGDEMLYFSNCQHVVLKIWEQNILLDMFFFFFFLKIQFSDLIWFNTIQLIPQDQMEPCWKDKRSHLGQTCWNFYVTLKCTMTTTTIPRKLPLQAGLYHCLSVWRRAL